MDPNIILLAGPNGAGKSTAAPDLLHGALHVDEFVNADVNPEGAALEAGRVMLSRLLVSIRAATHAEAPCVSVGLVQVPGEPQADAGG